METKGRILLVEGVTIASVGLRINLQLEGYDVIHAEDSRAALDLAGTQAPDLVLTDLAPPAVDGFALIEQLKRAGSGVPVIVASANDEESTRIAVLRLGADFLTRPISVFELCHLIDKRLCDGHSAAAANGRQIEKIGDAVFDPQSRTLRRGKTEWQLTPKEYDVLTALLQAKGEALSREELLRMVWGFDCKIESRRVQYQIDALRKKIEKDPERPRHLLTVRRVGWRLVL